MANSIALFKKYIALLDEVYKNASKSSVLDSTGGIVSAGNNANEIVIQKLDMNGLGDYSRNEGYVNGDVTLTNETVKFNYDRGRKFQVDSMDNEETAGLAFGRLSSEFIRTKVVPEVDSVRFSTYAGTVGIGKLEADLADGEAVLSALLVAQSNMDEAEVDEENRVLFITPTNWNSISALDTTKSREVLASFSEVIKVPQSRFYTAITLNDGTTGGQTAGGYIKAVGAKNINFMIIQKKAPIQFTKHVVNKVFSPDENQDADAWIFPFRAYALNDVYENKVAGIYMHNATA